VPLAEQLAVPSEEQLAVPSEEQLVVPSEEQSVAPSEEQSVAPWVAPSAEQLAVASGGRERQLRPQMLRCDLQYPRRPTQPRADHMSRKSGSRRRAGSCHAPWFQSRLHRQA